jgi:hypothetical protein
MFGSRHRATLIALMVASLFGVLGVASASAASQPQFVLKAGESFPASIGSSLHAGSVSFAWPTQTWGTCNADGVSGSITGPTSAALTFEWTGCSSGSAQWHSEGAPEGHVVISGTAHLDYTSWSAEKVALVLPLNEVKLISGGSSIKLRGNLVVPVGPTDTETTKLGLPIHEKGLGEQEFAAYENEAHQSVEARPQIEFGSVAKKAGIEIQGADELTVSKHVTVWTSPLGSPPPRAEYVLGSGSSFPVTLGGTAATAAASLGSAAGAITCSGADVRGTITASTSGGVQALELEHCKTPSGASDCTSTGAGPGIVSLAGTSSLAYISKAEGRVGMLFSFEPAEIACGTVKDHLKGELVIAVSPVGVQTSTLDLGLTRKGLEYENTYTSYENEKGERIATKLEANFGTGYKKAYLETGELAPTLNKSLTVTG